MKQVVIENPVINSPYDEPKRHFKFTEEGITDKTLRIPAINNHGRFGRWTFIEITDPWNAKNEIRAYLGSIHEA